MHTNIIIEKLLDATKTSSKKALAHKMKYKERSLHAAIANPTEAFYGRALMLAIREEIDLEWLFKNADTVGRDKRCQ